MNKALVSVLVTASLAGFTARAQAQHPGDPAAPAAVGQDLFLGSAAQGNEAEVTWWDRGRADSIPPAGVRFARPVAEGQWLLSYAYERQSLDGLRSGRDDQQTASLFASGYSTLSTSATFQTHAFEVYRGLSNGWTVFAGLPFVDREMQNWTSTGQLFTTHSDGIGDAFFGGIYDWRAGDGDLLRFNLALSIPTGDIDQHGTDENGASFLLPYAMQPGTGTHDLLPGVTLLIQESSWSWGLQAQGRFHVDTNSEGYSRARSGTASAWAAKGWTRQLSTSLRLQGLFASDIQGSAPEAEPTRNPLEDNQAQGGDRIDLAGGLQWLLGDGAGFGNLLTAEAAFPVDEWLKGPQLSTEWVLVLGWQLTF